MATQGLDPKYALHEWQALSLLVAYCILYRIPIHLSADTTVAPNRTRDDPAVIKARIKLVTYSTTACSVFTLLILLYIDANSNPLHLLGYWPIGVSETARALLLNSLLFAGPLYECLLIDGTWQDWANGLQPVRAVLSEWTEWRNIVAGPATEECLFRSAAVPLLILSGMSMMKVVFLTPLVFGSAHLIHFYESRITNPDTPISIAIIRALVQLTYTTLFGAYATFIYVRTGSLLAVIAVHAMCNAIGLRFTWGYVQPYWISPVAPKNATVLLLWTVPYYVLLFGGLIAWWSCLYSLTYTDMALVKL